MSKHILFMCVANSIRSQMAEALARHYFRRDIAISSAGKSQGRLSDEVVSLLAADGVSTAGQRSKSVDDIDLDTVDVAISVAEFDVLPRLPRTVEAIVWQIPDPTVYQYRGRADVGFRDVRDLLRESILALGRERGFLAEP